MDTTCMTGDVKVPVKIRKIFKYQDGTRRVLVGKVKIRAHPNHIFSTISKGTPSQLKASELTLEDYIILSVSLLRSSGDVFITDEF